MSFSVDPIAFHDITKSEDDMKDVETQSPTLSSLKREGDGLPAPAKQSRLNEDVSESETHLKSEETTVTMSGPLLGGTSRSRRMVTNNMTVQSAYMCL